MGIFNAKMQSKNDHHMHQIIQLNFIKIQDILLSFHVYNYTYGHFSPAGASQRYILPFQCIVYKTPQVIDKEKYETLVVYF